MRTHTPPDQPDLLCVVWFVLFRLPRLKASPIPNSMMTCNARFRLPSLRYYLGTVEDTKNLDGDGSPMTIYSIQMEDGVLEEGVIGLKLRDLPT